jgi:hypothetical protein
MAWYLRTVGGGTDAVEYQTLDQALEQVNTVCNRENARGRKVVKEDGRVSFYDGYDLIDAMWVEDEDGQKVPIP